MYPIRTKDAPITHYENFETLQRSIIDRYAHIWTVDHPNDPFKGIIPSLKVYSKLVNIASQNIAPSEQMWHDKTVRKWLVPQGGTFSKLTLQNCTITAYNIEVEPDLHEVDRYLEMALPLLMVLFKPYHVDSSLLIEDRRELYNCYDGSHRSSGGVTYDGDRRDYACRVKSMKDVYTYERFDPIIASMRRKDGKDREINMDSAANYFREAAVLHRLFERWAVTPVNHNYSDPELARYITTYRAKGAYAGDYKAMDRHYQRSVFERILKCWGAILGNLTPEWETAMYKLAHNIFNPQLIVADELWTGPVSLLSGIYPTHDPESMKNFTILFLSGLEMGLEFVMDGKKLKKNQFTIIVNGDDSIVLFGQYSKSLIDDFGCIHSRIARVFGQIVELDKLDYGDQFIGFCKRTWALDVHTKDFIVSKLPTGEEYPVPKYSALKALHALWEPEYLPNFPTKTDLVFWAGKILDNASGTRQWKGLAIAIFNLCPDLFIAALNEGPSDQGLIDLNRDFNNWKINWNPSSSPTIQLWYSRLKK